MENYIVDFTQWVFGDKFFSTWKDISHEDYLEAIEKSVLEELNCESSLKGNQYFLLFKNEGLFNVGEVKQLIPMNEQIAVFSGLTKEKAAFQVSIEDSFHSPEYIKKNGLTFSFKSTSKLIDDLFKNRRITFLAILSGIIALDLFVF